MPGPRSNRAFLLHPLVVVVRLAKPRQPDSGAALPLLFGHGEKESTTFTMHMKTKLVSLRSLALFASASLFATNAAHASFLSIHDTDPNETITVDANDFEGGLFVNGVLVQQGLHSPGTIT